MALVEFEQGGRTYQVNLRYDSSNIHSINLVRDNVSFETDLLTSEKIFVVWEKIGVMRILD